MGAEVKVGLLINMGLFMKKITISLLVSIMVILGSVGLAMAQQATSTIKGIRQDARQQIQETRQNVKGEAKELRKNVREEIKNDRGAIRKEFEAKRMEAKNLIESKREEFKNKIEAKRGETKSKIEAKRGELKERLIKIKDERKKQVVEKVYNQVNELNKRRLDHFSAVLEKLEKVLDKISNRTATAEANGRDISAVKTAITEATNAIALSRTAIQNQAGKVYSIVINTSTISASTSTESVLLRADVGKIRQALHSDLTGVQKTVKTAQEAVRKVATTLAQIPKVDELEVATSTATTTQSVQ